MFPVPCFTVIVSPVSALIIAMSLACASVAVMESKSSLTPDSAAITCNVSDRTKAPVARVLVTLSNPKIPVCL